MADMKLQQRLRKRGFVPLPKPDRYTPIAAEFPMRFMNIVHIEEGRLVAFVIAFDDTEGVWYAMDRAFVGLEDIGFTEMFAEDLVSLIPKKPH